MNVSGCWQRLRTYSLRSGVMPISISSRELYELLKLDAPNEEGAKCEPDEEDDDAPGMEMAMEGVPKFMAGMLISLDPNAWETLEPLPLPPPAPPKDVDDEETETLSELFLK